MYMFVQCTNAFGRTFGRTRAGRGQGGRRQGGPREHVKSEHFSGSLRGGTRRSMHVAMSLRLPPPPPPSSLLLSPRPLSSSLSFSPSSPSAAASPFSLPSLFLRVCARPSTSRGADVRPFFSHRRARSSARSLVLCRAAKGKQPWRRPAARSRTRRQRRTCRSSSTTKRSSSASTRSAPPPPPPRPRAVEHARSSSRTRALENAHSLKNAHSPDRSVCARALCVCARETTECDPVVLPRRAGVDPLPRLPLPQRHLQRVLPEPALPVGTCFANAVAAANELPFH